MTVVGQFDVQRALHRLIAAFPVDPELDAGALAGDVVHEQPLDSAPRFLEPDRSQVQVADCAALRSAMSASPNSWSCSRCLAVGAVFVFEKIAG